MNAPDPTERPGAHLVAEVLGIHPEDMTARHPRGTALDALGRMVAAAAEELDGLHSALTERARSAIDLLQPYAHGRNADLLASAGVLQSTGLDVDLLAAQRGTAYRHLTRLVGAYQRLLPEPVGSEPTWVQIF